MSLVSLTFGNGRSKMSTENIAKNALQIISRPEDHIRVEPGKEPTLEVQKISTFLGFNGVYIIGKVKSGIISPRMMGISPSGKTFRVTEIESKYPNCAVAKQGMTVGLSVEGLEKEDVIDVKELTFVAN